MTYLRAITFILALVCLVQTVWMLKLDRRLERLEDALEDEDDG